MTGLAAPSPATFAVQQVGTAGGMNAIRDALNFFANPPHFKGVLGTGVAVAATTNIAWPSVEDNYSAWDATNHWWVVPAGCGGLYLATVQIKWGTTQPAANIVISVVGGAAGTTAIAHSPAPEALANNAGLDLTDFVRVNAGDKIGVQTLNSGFTSSADTVESTYFNFAFYGI